MRYLIVAVLLLLTVIPSFAQHTTTRTQWQPTLPNAPQDVRLDQRFTLDIVGRAAIPVLEILSSKTGVSLAVASEDVKTLGERKLTIIARQLTLRGLMVQILEALQECHWDVVEEGEKTRYLLHRNSGVERTEKILTEQAIERSFAWEKSAREARFVAARQALAMSPEELAELEKTDPLLAHAVQEPQMYKWMNLFFNLPAKMVRQVEQMKPAEVTYNFAQGSFRDAITPYIKQMTEESSTRGDSDSARELMALLDSAEQADVSFYALGMEVGSGLVVRIHGKGKHAYVIQATVLPPQFASRKNQYRELFINTGMDAKTAEALCAESERDGRILLKQREEDRKRREWIKPEDKTLHQNAGPFNARIFPERVDFLRVVADITGYSVISDYYCSYDNSSIPFEAYDVMPLWRLLYMLGDSIGFKWQTHGDCLVFHDKSWYRLAPGELPESFVMTFRERLKRKGRFTMDDMVDAAKALVGHPLRWGMTPTDLSMAGLNEMELASPLPTSESSMTQLIDSTAIMLYASLTPQQRAQARSATGLQYQHMTRVQQQQVQQRVQRWFSAMPAGDIPKSVFRIEENVIKDNVVNGNLLKGGPMCTLILDFPSASDRHSFLFRPYTPLKKSTVSTQLGK